MLIPQTFPIQETGFAEIDADHWVLFSLLREMGESALSRPEAQAFCQRLEDYAAAHFVREERLMRQFGYPGLNGHVAQHNLFAQKVEGLSRALAKQTDIAADQLVQKHKLLKFLFEWFIEHVNEKDREFAEFRRREEPASELQAGAGRESAPAPVGKGGSRPAKSRDGGPSAPRRSAPPTVTASRPWSRAVFGGLTGMLGAGIGFLGGYFLAPSLERVPDVAAAPQVVVGRDQPTAAPSASAALPSPMPSPPTSRTPPEAPTAVSSLPGDAGPALVRAAVEPVSAPAASARAAQERPLADLSSGSTETVAAWGQQVPGLSEAEPAREEAAGRHDQANPPWPTATPPADAASPAAAGNEDASPSSTTPPAAREPPPAEQAVTEARLDPRTVRAPALDRTSAGSGEAGGSAQDPRLTPLLSRANELIARQRLTRPPGDNALAVIQQAQRLAPDDPRVSPALERLAENLLVYVDRDIAALRLSRPAENNAIDRLRRIDEILPGYSGAVARQGAVVDAYFNLYTQKRAANPAQAEGYLQQALSVYPDHPRAAELRGLLR